MGGGAGGELSLSFRAVHPPTQSPFSLYPSLLASFSLERGTKMHYFGPLGGGWEEWEGGVRAFRSTFDPFCPPNRRFGVPFQPQIDGGDIIDPPSHLPKKLRFGVPFGLKIDILGARWRVCPKGPWIYIYIYIYTPEARVPRLMHNAPLTTPLTSSTPLTRSSDNIFKN